MHALLRSPVWLITTAFICAGARAEAATVHVLAAASLSDCLAAIGAAYEERTGDVIVFNFGASSLLARQIEQGAPADIFFSADEAKMDSLAKAGLIVADTRKSRLSNSLVIVVATDRSLTIPSPHALVRPEIERIALADPKTVPAGIYARQYLHNAGLWQQLEPKVVPTGNVRGALAAVESGNAAAGIVYKTDAAISTEVKVAFEVPATDGPAISYPLALMKDALQPEAARRFLAYLDSQDAARVFEKFGFIVLDGSSSSAIR